MDVLAETVLDAMKEINYQRKVDAEEGESRRVRALDLALFKLKALNAHVHKSRRALNDLRMVRRLMLNERLSRADQLFPSVDLREGKA
jgi:hypothetical protein